MPTVDSMGWNWSYPGKFRKYKKPHKIPVLAKDSIEHIEGSTPPPEVVGRCDACGEAINEDQDHIVGHVFEEATFGWDDWGAEVAYHKACYIAGGAQW